MNNAPAPPRRRKIVQIAHGPDSSELFALADDGSVWMTAFTGGQKTFVRVDTAAIEQST
jgi:hypothetical protein